MARRRFFVPEIHNGHAELLDEDARHLTQVLRVEAGQQYEISDNRDVYLAEVDTARKSRVVFRVTGKLESVASPTRIHLLAALIKFERLELMIEKATELGVERITLVNAVRSERGLDQGAAKRLHRWRRIALEASQQSRRAKLPEVEGPVRLQQALTAAAAHRLFLDEERTGAPLLSAVKQNDAALLVGPEGGWTPDERSAAAAAGWTSVSLGPQILRAETAAIAAIAVINAASGAAALPSPEADEHASA